MDGQGLPIHVPKPMLLHAPSTSHDWLSLEIEVSAGASEDVSKEAQGASDAVRQKMAGYLQSVLTTPNLVVLAGSGTSLGSVGGPSMADLWTKAKSLPNFEDVVHAVKHAENDSWIENLLSRCKVASDFIDDKEVAKKVFDFLKASEKMIWAECSGFLDNADLDAHQTFLRRMARRRLRTPRLKLFTTNYDLCFERAASDLGIVAIDGFSFAQPRRFNPRFFHYDLIRRGRGGDEAHDFVEGVVLLYKLHGSVNWDRTERGVVQCEEPEDPCMMFPTNTKFEQSYSQPHLELMAQFQPVLREPNTALVVIGFGFNDKHLTENIMAAVDSNPSLKLLVVDPAVKAKSEAGNGVHSLLRNKIAGGEADIALLNADFAQFAEIIPQLRALSPAEQIERSVRQIAQDT